MTIVVADDGGHPLALERLDGCAPIASYIATEKARSSALGRRETKGYEDMVNNGRTAFLSAPVVCSLEGGVPVVVDGHVIGSVGVSGDRRAGRPDRQGRRRRPGQLNRQGERQMTEVTLGRLQVAANLQRFIEDEVLPGTGIEAAAFWQGLDTWSTTGAEEP